MFVGAVCGHGAVLTFDPAPPSLGVLRRVPAVSGLGPGPVRPGLLPHQAGPPPDDARRRPLPSPVEGGP